MDLETFKERARKADPESRKLTDWIARQKPSDLDKTVSSFHDEVFEETDCLKCANCCKTTSPIFYERDIERAAKSLRLRPSEFIEKYLKIDEDKDYVLKSSPCPFLDYENYCTIYSDRPSACREYPHTNRKRFYQISKLTYRNTHVCPAAFEVVQKLRKHYKF